MSAKPPAHELWESGLPDYFPPYFSFDIRTRDGQSLSFTIPLAQPVFETDTTWEPLPGPEPAEVETSQRGNLKPTIRLDLANSTPPTDWGKFFKPPDSPPPPPPESFGPSPAKGGEP
jgi:hypothetical protein